MIGSSGTYITLNPKIAELDKAELKRSLDKAKQYQEEVGRLYGRPRMVGIG